MRRLYFILVGVSLLVSSLGRATPIDYVEDRRSLTWQRYLGGGDYQGGVDVPAVPFENWSVCRGDGRCITSQLHSDRILGWLEGSNNAYPSLGILEYGRPVYDVSFDLAETQIVSLDLHFQGSGHWMNVEAALYRDGAVILGSSSVDVIGLQSDQQTPLPELFYTATLDPGRYRLRVALLPLYMLEVPEVPGGASRFTYFDFRVAPEPDTSALLAWGLVGVAAGRRFQRSGVRL